MIYVFCNTIYKMNNKISLVLNLSVVTISLLIGSCKAKKVTTNECDGTSSYSYSANVKSIIDVNCANTCHSAENKAGKIDLSTYASLKTISSEGRFLGAIRHLAGFDPMPMKAPKLADSTIKIISCWVKNGAPE